MANELTSTGNNVQQQQQDFGPRVKGAMIVKPIVFGNVARYFGHKRSNGHTHEWKVYLRLYNNEDPSGYIKKVHFKLHDSYPTSLRICEEPPYEVEETGWGEFEVNIKIYFVDPTERPVSVYHMLKLFKIEPGAAPDGGPMPVFTDYIVSEFYDELVFSEPSSTMLKLLKSAPQLPPSMASRFEKDFEKEKEETLQTLISHRNRIGAEIDDLKRRIQTTKDEIAKYQSNIV
ncbi:YEATS domain-containing protein 4-like protein [Euroglyphus maynei]|uniref:YEATS domain-containing protein 4-like protein n=1 Tax=Euroglyphus maynei TaxID=6958 RepID=A0A1Y3BUN9_EURMA|nr:YEATS domain-containing protein 4-like protein [Euroglyphus maynei]